jgi:ubiquinone/menaquinone biosynthesis C-methylase UbiE
MKKIYNDLDIIIGVLEEFGSLAAGNEKPLKDKVIIDVGCGSGDLVRDMAEQGARVIGVDTLDMIKKATQKENPNNEVFIVGKGEELPVENDEADMIIFMASFHHIPKEKMVDALLHCKRALKKNGLVLFIEPVAQDGSYFELIRIVEDERDIQAIAYGTIKEANSMDFATVKEEMIYFERSYADYENLLDFFVDEEIERNRFKDEAYKTATSIASEAGQTLDNYRFKSICRLNALMK